MTSVSASAGTAELRCRLLDWALSDKVPQFDAKHLLGGVTFGVRARNTALAVTQAAGNAPILPLAAPMFSQETRECSELWFSRSAVVAGTVEGVTYRCDGQVLYGVIEVDETAYAATAGDAASPLQRATQHAYARIFALLDQLGYPYLWRVWNYLADINGEAEIEGRLERYRQFNIGRYQAFSVGKRLNVGNVPAASALGVVDGSVAIAFMAGRIAPLSLENPRQMPAYEYPAAYGPRSPTFARAALAQLPGQELLFVSGTASIVGHATMHVGDVLAQTRETLANIAAVVAEANRQSPTASFPWMLDEMSYRAYIRNATDFESVQHVVCEVLGEKATVMYVQADVCRADLLVEVEAFASRAVAGQAA